MSIGKNIKKLRELHNLSQKELAEIAGVSDKAVSTWENNIKDPRMGAIQKIADHFGILKSDIIEDKIEILSKHPHTPKVIEGNSVKMPLLGSIAAGLPLDMAPIQEWVNVPVEVAERYPNAFLVTVNGDSMNKLIPPNVLALIDPTQEVRNGDVAAVAVNGYDATLKRFFKFQNGITLEPESFNPKHKTQYYDAKTQEHTPIHIKGKLVWYMPPLDIKF
ncbi:XRE family transcriptional regulator [Priestia flexa]|uniref:LexA family protein n=1 Tax=Priestia TaxID=2800373 RepID=UPI00077CCA4E|nr:XRE family transcriptional regulator [Priestia flexa]AQX55930.1 LexA repressor [Priestia flexa]MCM3066811.1 XRE family transcriptional regulator [Priestia flexa]MCP1188137.1 XRE family transcriptional regulator [Priestia flexa]MED4589459.1 XRE family transcriptional regulator [Priestia flexa]